MTCPKCGEVLPENATTCSFCGEAVTPVQAAPFQNETSSYIPPVEEKPENVVGGTIGSLIGALIGGALMVVLMMAETVAAISGVVLAFCALKGYELLAGKLSRKGIFISIAFMVIIPALAYFLGTTISLQQVMIEEGPIYYGIASDTVTLGQAWETLVFAIQNSSETVGYMIKDLLMLYGFTALGAVALVINAFKKKK